MRCLLVCCSVMALSACASSPSFITADEGGGTLTRVGADGAMKTLSVPAMPHNVQTSTDGRWILATGMSGGHDHAHAGHATGSLMVIDAIGFDEKTLRSITVGEHPAHVITDAAGKTAYVTDSANDCIVIVDISSGAINGRIKVGKFPHGARINTNGSELYTANVNDGTVSVVDLKTKKETHRIHAGKMPIQVAVTPDSKKLYVTLAKDSAVAIIALTTYKKLHSIAVPNAPAQVYADPLGRYMYVADQGNKEKPGAMISVIDVATDKVIKNIATGRMPHGIVASRDGKFLYVTNMGEDTVSELEVPGFAIRHTYHVGHSPNGITLLE